MPTIGPLPSWISAAAFSPDGRPLAAGSAWCGIRLWDVATGGQLREMQVADSPTINLVEFDPTGTRLAAANSRHVVQLWDVETGRPLAAMKVHTGDVKTVAFHPWEDRPATGATDKTVRVWDPVSGAEILKLNEPAASCYEGCHVRFSDDGTQLHTTTDGTAYKTYDTTPVGRPAARQ